MIPDPREPRYHIRQAREADAERVHAVLIEAATWLVERGMAMWQTDEIDAGQVAADVALGQYFLAECDGDVAGILRFQLDDMVFWPDAAGDDAAYLHRFAIRRPYAGGQLSQALLRFAAERARGLGRRVLRLDCEAARPKLRAVYEAFGFRHHSDRLVGPYFVARYELSL